MSQLSLQEALIPNLEHGLEVQKIKGQLLDEVMSTHQLIVTNEVGIPTFSREHRLSL